MHLTNAIFNALANLVILVGLPFLGYWLYHKLRHRRTFVEITRRAGLRLGEGRYILYCLAFAAVVVAVLLIWPPPLEPFLRKGSAQQSFVGLGLNATAFAMALIYGVVKTGFAEEFLFRGLIAGSLGRRLSLAWANFWQAVIFLLPHLALLFIMPELWWIQILVFGSALFTGWVRIRSGSIVGPWLAHAAANVAMCLSVAARTANL